jgi:hypothetical protein
MVQLVFVHGVATRSGDGYEQAVKNRDTLFKEILFEGRPVEIRSPQWGDLVPPVNPKVFETDSGVASFALLGETQGMGGGLNGGVMPVSDLSLASIARTNSAIALDAIFAELVETADRNGTALNASNIAAFRKATQAIYEDKTDELLGDAATDEEISFNLDKDQDNTFSIGSQIKEAIEAVTDRLRNTVSTVGFGAVRDNLSPAVALFLGDVFTYLKEGTLRSEIQAKVRADLKAAHEASKVSGEPLVLIGHSLGGVILTDMLFSPKESGLPDDLKVDALITVGSQSGLFQSVGLLIPLVPAGQLIPRPKSVLSWYNVFDPIDPLAFRADPIFSGVLDKSFDSISGLASAHTTYFKRPQFYARCRKRLQEIKVI